MTSFPIPRKNSIWYAPGNDLTIMERVQVLQTVVVGPYGRFILYKQIDWPDFSNLHPLCTHESTFHRLYTAQDSSPIEDSPCAPSLQENSFSKISWRERLFFFIRPRVNSKTPPQLHPNSSE